MGLRCFSPAYHALCAGVIVEVVLPCGKLGTPGDEPGMFDRGMLDVSEVLDGKEMSGRACMAESGGIDTGDDGVLVNGG